MTWNTFGRVFRFTTWGESHGPALGVVLDGCPPGIPLSEADIQPWLDARKPGGSRHVTQRREADEVRILSGVFEDDRAGAQVTTGTPISLLIENTDQRSKDYGEIARQYRPGHADITYDAKYGVRDHRGGGRSSARETAARVAAGAVARKVLGEGVSIRAAVVRLGGLDGGGEALDWEAVGGNPLNCPYPGRVAAWEAYLDDVRSRQTSVGAEILLEVQGVPPGWGAPVYAKLDADLAAAMMSINAAKAVSLGEDPAGSILEGHERLDAIRMGPEGPEFLSNHAGGVLGGISTGQPILARVAFKPTSSITTPRPTIDRDGHEVEVITKGRHDPCVAIRAVPVVEAMAALVLVDHKLLHRAQTGREGPAGTLWGA